MLILVFPLHCTQQEEGPEVLRALLPGRLNDIQHIGVEGF